MVAGATASADANVGSGFAAQLSERLQYRATVFRRNLIHQPPELQSLAYCETASMMIESDFVRYRSCFVRGC